ncbi:Gfo/Idh/MocA family oxidoreductase [Paenibacillus spongiae]|uniref:Gfo/Idh/MocA family oxidoreductase n=1 Tax=Paenibacillus spongiae TaxID=2909671 RepID=UPI0021AD15EE|nr:Gfo/Idh/MocA family oxidoreductase [Paenibacillus spongiae]
MDLTSNAFMEAYYHQAEREDGYIRDRCVFHEEIDIYDTMSVQVRYDSGALLTYSLVAYSPYEGWRATLNGNDGRMELIQSKVDNRIRIYKPDGTYQDIEVPSDEGGHGGGDERLLKALFEGGVADPLKQQADSFAGALSLLIGHAANQSIQEGEPVHIHKLLHNSAS